MEFLNFLFILLEVIVLFNILIIVHELGHFLAAKWRGLVVERFGIWFGKSLWEREINKYMDSVKENRALGELDHPESSIINLKKSYRQSIIMKVIKI
mgnify:CR=1 FL=1